MIDLFAEKHGDDLPEFMDVTFEQVERYWDEWLVWRSVGKHDAMSGSFEPNVDYIQAMQSIPAEELSVFLQLDNLYWKMESQYLRQTGKKNNNR